MYRRLGLVMAFLAVSSFVVLGQGFDDLANVDQAKPSATGDVEIPEVKGVLVHADYNTDHETEADPERAAELKDTIEGSVSFMIEVPFEKIVENMLKPGTLGKISPNIESYEATLAKEDDRFYNYKVKETLVPFKLPLVNLARSTVHLDMTVYKQTIQDGRIVVDYKLDPTQKNDWKRFAGSIYAVDLHNGQTMVMVTTSTKSNYNIFKNLRLKLAKYFLGKTKDNIASWILELDRAAN